MKKLILIVILAGAVTLPSYAYCGLFHPLMHGKACATKRLAYYKKMVERDKRQFICHSPYDAKHPMQSIFAATYWCADSELSPALLAQRQYQRKLELARASAPIIIGPGIGGGYNAGSSAVSDYVYGHESYNRFQQFNPGALPWDNPFYQYK
ncbi:MAG: hypothetical protein HY094_05330 [Candidatus Melainabacteria bacterium]|nr:hypothetical protein [Candidatus Melainabacteria bacterium]